jgi:peptidoglycan/xylan/chitin deacetylase (PgdA/CDA1 family)
MYHAVVSVLGNTRRYAVTADEFRQQLEYLRRTGYRSIHIDDLWCSKGSTGKEVMITFDDGFDTDVTVALPLLKEYGFKSVHFIVPDFIGTQGYMNWGQVKSLVDAGAQVQSHTKSHRLLQKLEPQEIKDELLHSKKEIEDRIGSAVTALSLPKGSRPPGITVLLRECGYRYLFTSEPRVNVCAAEDAQCCELGRVMIPGRMTLKDLEKIVDMDTGFYSRLKASFYVKSLLKKIIPYGMYYKFWKTFAK